MVQYLLNDKVHQSTGVKPSDIKYGLHNGCEEELFDSEVGKKLVGSIGWWRLNDS